RNSRLSRQWLLSAAPQTLANFVRFNYDQWEWTSHLEDYLQRGEARDIHDTLDAPRWRNYMLGLRDIAGLSADELAAGLRFPAPPRRLLDVGGGHCWYSLVMCHRYPGLHATIVDLEPAARIGQELVTAAGLADRFEFRHGRVTETDLGQNHDAAFMFNLVHHLDEKTNREAFRQIHDALSPQGMLVVWEAFLEERQRQRKDQLGSLLGLFFGIISRQQTYEFNQVAGWAREAGFREIRRQTLRSAPFASLLIASK
ncbi:MAG: class I SAM-dependent methyltransferase, partial [Candidatus Acidiferrales bacterium]